MKQMSLSESGFERKTKRTRKREFLEEMNLVVLWAELVSLIAPYAPRVCQILCKRTIHRRRKPASP